MQSGVRSTGETLYDRAPAAYHLAYDRSPSWYPPKNRVRLPWWHSTSDIATDVCRNMPWCRAALHTSDSYEYTPCP